MYRVLVSVLIFVVLLVVGIKTDGRVVSRLAVEDGDGVISISPCGIFSKSPGRIFFV